MAWFGSLFGCTQKPKVVTIDQLKFPVIRILESSSENQDRSQARVILDKEGLSHIPVQSLFYVTDPLIIDSNANVLDMKDIKNEHGGLWAMLHPQGEMPVKFTLVQRKETGIEAARDLVANCRFLGRDLDSQRTEFRRERIRKATNGEEIIQIILETPPLNGKLITDLIYDSVGYYHPEVKRIPVSRDGLHGFLDEYAKVAIPVMYERVWAFQQGKAKVILDGRTFFINPDGLEVAE